MTGWMREVTEVIEEVNGAHAITGSLSVTRGRTISDFRGCWELDSMISLGMDFYVVHNSVCVCGGGGGTEQGAVQVLQFKTMEAHCTNHTLNLLGVSLSLHGSHAFTAAKA